MVDLGCLCVMGVLNEKCLGAGWFRPVMTSMVDVDTSFGILNLIIPSPPDAAYGSRLCGHVKSWKT